MVPEGTGRNHVDPGHDPDQTDTDGDGIADNIDAFPNDSTETADTDNDGIGDNADPDDDNGHGTAVAGIIAAEADNAIGSYGVAPAAELLPIKACQPKEPGGLAARCTTSTLVKALDVAMAEDAAIINMSLAGPPDDLLTRYVNLALDQVVFIPWSAGVMTRFEHDLYEENLGAGELNARWWALVSRSEPARRSTRTSCCTRR